jgi:hypothetical protein
MTGTESRFCLGVGTSPRVENGGKGRGYMCVVGGEVNMSEVLYMSHEYRTRKPTEIVLRRGKVS